eukprot:gnl/TRDRNA2_/TRDRNA2_57852_c0_seq1.p1 gnl/TRDRNA2_/TRDRNA2_57852_c0~~gnl/TRDRNA2_/TRDRNA2_57852_c0_seq1.p1  ORF type:complete len:519 (-),score=58.52 gnl/TRDRNA2_/TRDRNA2_57852_c0_seq1:39-1595(-)
MQPAMGASARVSWSHNRSRRRGASGSPLQEAACMHGYHAVWGHIEKTSSDSENSSGKLTRSRCSSSSSSSDTSSCPRRLVLSTELNLHSGHTRGSAAPKSSHLWRDARDSVRLGSPKRRNACERRPRRRLRRQRPRRDVIGDDSDNSDTGGCVARGEAELRKDLKFLCEHSIKMRTASSAADDTDTSIGVNRRSSIRSASFPARARHVCLNVPEPGCGSSETAGPGPGLLASRLRQPPRRDPFTRRPKTRSWCRNPTFGGDESSFSEASLPCVQNKGHMVWGPIPASRSVGTPWNAAVPQQTPASVLASAAARSFEGFLLRSTYPPSGGGHESSCSEANPSLQSKNHMVWGSMPTRSGCQNAALGCATPFTAKTTAPARKLPVTNEKTTHSAGDESSLSEGKHLLQSKGHMVWGPIQGRGGVVAKSPRTHGYTQEEFDHSVNFKRSLAGGSALSGTEGNSCGSAHDDGIYEAVTGWSTAATVSDHGHTVWSSCSSRASSSECQPRRARSARKFKTAPS